MICKMEGDQREREEGRSLHESLDELEGGAGGKGVKVFDAAHALLDLSEDDALLSRVAEAGDRLDEVADKLKVRDLLRDETVEGSVLLKHPVESVLQAHEEIVETLTPSKQHHLSVWCQEELLFYKGEKKQ